MGLTAIRFTLLALLCIASAGASPLIAGDLIPAPPHPLPTFSFSDSHGQTMSLSGFKGHGLILTLWATWCAPCLTELPTLDRLAADGVRVIAVNQDLGGQDVAERYMQKHRLQHLALYTDPTGSVAERLGVAGLPVSVVINREGREIARVSGALNWDDPVLRQRLAALLESAVPESVDRAARTSP